MLKPVIQRAMATLSARINTSTGLNDPNDRAATISLLETLHSAGESFEPEALAAWASLNGWSARGVAQIRLAANDVLSGKRHGYDRPVWQADIVKELGSEPGVERGR